MWRKIIERNLKTLHRRCCTNTNDLIKGTTPRRAVMYVPGNDKKKISKAFGLNVDCIALDCEDGVAINKKAEARETIKGILNENEPKQNFPYDLGVRINSVSSEFFRDDLREILSARNLPDTVLLPKVNTPSDLILFSETVNALVKSNSKVDLIIYIESALAFINIVDICKTAVELSKTGNFTPAALVFGSDDFCANIGVTRSEDSKEIIYARQKLVLTAKAFDLQAIDMVYIKYKDLEGLKKNSEEGAQLGYTGKQVIHPGQVPIVQSAFLPSQKQIEWATKLLAAFEEHQKVGKGAFNYEGDMIDMPTMKQAQNIVKLAKLNS